jgi:hypothetical protein
MDSILERYVRDIEEACAERKEFVVTLRVDSLDEALEKVFLRGVVTGNILGVVARVKYKDLDMSITHTGRMLVRNAESIDKLKEALRELLI